MGNYHQDAQKFINSAKGKGMKVKAEGSELIAYPKGSKAKPKEKSLVGMIKDKILNKKPATDYGPFGVIGSGVGLVKDIIAKQKSEKGLDIMKQKKAKSLSPTGEMRREGGEWVPYSYGKNIK